MNVVIDSSALLAWLGSEPGSDSVGPALDGGLLCSVNWSEVLQKTLQWGVPADGLHAELSALGLRVVAFDASLAERAAHLRSVSTDLGLSLGDRACLALAQSEGLPVITADRAWTELAVGVEVRLIR